MEKGDYYDNEKEIIMIKVSLFSSEENRFFTVKYMFYTKTEIKKLVKKNYPKCEIISIT